MAVESGGSPDEVVADETWRVYQMRNDSVIVDLFQGQYRSTLICPVCTKVKNKKQNKKQGKKGTRRCRLNYNDFFIPFVKMN